MGKCLQPEPGASQAMSTRGRRWGAPCCRVLWQRVQVLWGEGSCVPTEKEPKCRRLVTSSPSSASY